MARNYHASAYVILLKSELGDPSTQSDNDLVRSIVSSVRYIGSTTNFGRRMGEHISDAANTMPRYPGKAAGLLGEEVFFIALPSQCIGL